MITLVLGNINSKWIKEYIEYVLLPLGHTVHVLGDIKTCKYSEFYSSNNILVLKEIGATSIISRFPYFRVLNSVSRTIKGNNWCNYDYIINLFVSHKHLRIMRRIKDDHTKTIVYYVGSDLLRASNIKILMNRIILPHPSAIVVGSNKLAYSIKKKYSGHVQFNTIHFGISAFDSIDDLRPIKKSIPKTTFCIGYNGSPFQNHIKVINLFNKLPSEIKKKIKLVVPMTYGGTSEYIEMIKCKLIDSEIEFYQPTDFLDNHGMAELWSEVSYFINSQLTDSLSASVLEALYSGSILINASWLNYPEYDEYQIKYISYSNFDELYELLLEIFKGNIEKDKYNCSHVLKKFLSWNSAKESWRKLFLQL